MTEDVIYIDPLRHLNIDTSDFSIFTKRKWDAIDKRNVAELRRRASHMSNECGKKELRSQECKAFGRWE